MIHSAKILASCPGVTWAQKKQVLRDRTVYDPSNRKLVKFEGIFIDSGVVYCEKGSIKVWDASGKAIDISSKLQYEFVKYDSRRRLIILATLTMDDEEGQSFEAIFPRLKDNETFLGDRLFLIIPVNSNSKQVAAVALLPTGDDAHDEYGVCASAEYIEQLVRTAGR